MGSDRGARGRGERQGWIEGARRRRRPWTAAAATSLSRAGVPTPLYPIDAEDKAARPVREFKGAAAAAAAGKRADGKVDGRHGGTSGASRELKGWAAAAMVWNPVVVPENCVGEETGEPPNARLVESPCFGYRVEIISCMRHHFLLFSSLFPR
ncbi:hypothetical protein C2845_PM07G10950 [Panicum miliaceum]|uniref:Uncharacterized protein n=1 Tax=Panicum miliaceum TaxID=4540 RepID=A0A3L6SMB5_PANMI|nr:hypothetical protein C2845_PM07G10950 [Panicum miliaceum]